MNFKSSIAGSIFTTITLLGGIGHAGWSSGGGELIRDQNNPWFLSNTKTVKYCIQIDEKNFGQTKDQVRARIVKAFQFWQMQLPDLSYAKLGDPNNFNTAIGTQNFIEESCTKTTDVTFQFGVLTAEQQQKLKDLDRTIGITVRTEYDPVIMKGQGFVYIAPESGALKPTLDKNVEKIWSNYDGTLLFPVLVHEVGHIFGLQHDSQIDGMQEDFVQSIFESYRFGEPNYYPTWWARFENERWNKLKIFRHDPFGENEFRMMCASAGVVIGAPEDPTDPTNPGTGSKKITRKSKNKHKRKLSKKNTETSVKTFFNLPENATCESYYIEDGKFIISAEYKDQPSMPSVKMGEMNLQLTDRLWADKDIIKVWFPKEQKVIPDSEFFSAYPIGSMYSEFYYKGNYVSADGKTTRRIVVTTTPNGVHKISGTLNGEIYQNIIEGF